MTPSQHEVPGICSVPICDKPIAVSGLRLCDGHYARYYKKGNLRPNDPLGKRLSPLTTEGEDELRIIDEAYRHRKQLSADLQAARKLGENKEVINGLATELDTARRDLIDKLTEAVRNKRLTQVQIATKLGLKQVSISSLIRSGSTEPKRHRGSGDEPKYEMIAGYRLPLDKKPYNRKPSSA